ncbi:MAG: AAA family ATPase [candidate division KSB1 bacterium]|nr:AAA family ATPase [candidate division KSB1 bacterium]MDZ7273180.1 AAA family ATPase [candidate division KSB1 bacterium]MDZ7285282.1 AAA family ATPase [candidate division KSB1 bacterium]MDZ7298314.1 AAA family ATPase [candidate division KSB1 bacterium]MDZ7307389.1 AAA family ATPase [candidate division KSB1 bacterium]
MTLEKIIVKNLGPHRELRQFELGGLTVFYGANFSGKTTLARAVYFALTGRALTTGLKPPALASANAASGTVGLFYQHQQKRFRLYRSTRGDLQIEQADHEKWQRCDEGADFLPALNFQQWRLGCFLHEDELGEFLVQTPASRRELLNQLLGVESLLQVQELFIQVRRLAKRRERTATGLQESLRLEGLADRAVELQVAKSAVAKVEARLQAFPETTPATGPDERLRRSWEQARAAAQTRLAHLQQQLESVRAGFTQRDELAALLQQSMQHLSQRDAALRELESRTELRIALTGRLRQVEELVAALQGWQGRETCPTCQQPLAPATVEKLLADYRTKHEALAREREYAAAKEHEARETVCLLDELARKQAELEQRLQRWQQLEAEIALAQEELQTWEARLATLAPPSPADETRGQLQQELEALRRQLAELERQQMLYEQRHQAIMSANRQVESVTRHRRLSEWAAEAVARTVQSVVGISLKKADAEIAACLQNFGCFRAQPQKIDLEKSQLLPDVDGRALPTLSGSEKTILYLSMKIALSRLMPGADFLLLDDPTLLLDETRRGRLRDYFLRLLPEKQIIIFTGDRGFAEQFANARRIDLSS